MSRYCREREAHEVAACPSHVQTHRFGHAWLWHVHSHVRAHTHLLPGRALATRNLSHDQHCQDAAALHVRATLPFSGVYKAQ